MVPEREINTLCLTYFKYWFVIIGVMAISLSLVFFTVFLGLNHYISLWVMLIGILISAIAPPLFVRLKINLIAKKTKVHFTEESIYINASKSINEKFIYSDIQNFSVTDYSVDHTSSIGFLMRNGIKRRYVFFKQFNNDENILNNVLNSFNCYNKTKQEKIQIAPSFFLKKSGKIFIRITGLIILICLIIQIIYKPTATPASLLGVLGAYIQAKTIQIRDQKIIDKFRNENH